MKKAATPTRRDRIRSMSPHSSNDLFEVSTVAACS